MQIYTYKSLDDNVNIIPKILRLCFWKPLHVPLSEELR